MEELFKEDMYVNVATATRPQALRGRLLTRLAGPAEASGQAIMLAANSTAVTGLAWTSIDLNCRLHYHVRTNDQDGDAESALELQDFPLKNLKALPLFPGTKSSLQQCKASSLVSLW